VTLRGIIEKAPGRIIVGSFASLLSRLEQVTRFAEEYGRKIAVDGFSMKTNVEIAKQMGYIKVNQSSLIDISEVSRYPSNKVLIMCTGAQGEGRAVLMRIANGEHRFVNIEPTDTVIFSSSVVPGNERSVQRLQDTLYRKGAEVIHYQMMDVHAGGHGKTEDVKLLLTLVRPQYYIPIEGNHFMLRLNARNAEKLGMAKDHILVADNGQVMEFTKPASGATGRLTNEVVPTDAIMVDGLGVGDVSEIVLRDRQLLAADGMIVVIATVEKKTGKILGNPDIISRGFVYLKENKEMIDEVRHHVKKTVQDHDPLSQADEYEIKNKIRESVGQLILQRTQRRPMVLPVVIEV
jgi:ribonuclease J